MTQIKILIDWKRSRTWGHNPHANAVLETKDRIFHASARCSGCGYDKESTVVAEVLNKLIRDKATAYAKAGGEFPYGVHTGDDGPHFSGGVGMSSIQKCLEAMGADVSHISSNHSDAWFIIFKDEERITP